jgi:sortase A
VGAELGGAPAAAGSAAAPVAETTANSIPPNPQARTEAGMTALQERTVTPSQEPEPSDAVSFSETRAARVLRSVGISLAMLGVLVLMFVSYLVGVSGAQHNRDQTTMYANFRDRLAQGTAPVRPTKPGDPVAIFEIPRLKLREVVVEGTSASELTHGPGHRRDTPLPGQVGVSALYGRAMTFGGPFGGLKTLRAGDAVTVTTGQGTARYTISNTDGTVPVPEAGASTLVLVSADSQLTQRQDVIITAQLVGQAWPGNPTLPVIAKSEVGLQGEPSAVVALVLWCQALLIGAGATTWGYVRWSRWPTYLISAPVLIAILWNVFENTARLLPNTF